MIYLSFLSHKLLITSLYITQYIGTGFLIVAMIAILRKHGASLTDLSWIYLLGLPWVFKFLWAPLIDRIQIPRLGHYRGWLLIFQALMIVSLLVISELSLETDLNLIAIIGFVFVFFSASQDIATDALATNLFERSERGVVNGLQTAGGLLGNLIGGGGVLMLYPYLGWQGAFHLLAFFTAVSWLQLLFFDENNSQRTPTVDSIGKTFLRFITFWYKKGLWFALLITYPIGLCLVYAILIPLLLDSGLSLSETGLAINIFGGIVGAIAALGAGEVIRFLGRQRSLIIFIILQVVGFAVIFFAIQPSNSNVYLALAIYYILYPIAMAILTTLMMDLAATSDSPATDYSIQFSLYMLLGLVFYPIALQLAQNFSYQGVVLIAISTAICALIITWLYCHFHLNNSEADTE